MDKNDGAASLVRSDALLAALKAYRCQYTLDQDGGGLDLVDALSPGDTIAEGNLELELLAEHLGLAIDEANSVHHVTSAADTKPTSGTLTADGDVNGAGPRNAK